jgi:hypothetical protein
MTARVEPEAIKHLRAVEWPAIETRNRSLPDVTADALAALRDANDPPRLFVRGGALTRVRRDEDARPIIEPLGEPELRGQLARAADWMAAQKGKPPEHVSPPKAAVQDVLALGEWDFPPLVAVVEAPALRPDGTVLDKPGYDPATRLMFAPRNGLEVPAIHAAPTADQRARAMALIEEALCDFPFADEASKANAIALALTPVVRPAIIGQVPLALLDATKAGTGKGLLASLVATIATGRPAAVFGAPVREEEWAKQLLSVLMRGSTFVLIDEASELKSPSLARALTAATFADRILGASQIAEVPQRATWLAAGNNIRLGGDIPRRCYWVRLDAKVSQPWARNGFKHPDLLEWANDHRGALLAALLTVARAWFADDCPAAHVPTIGGFVPWSRTVGGILAHAGINGFLGNLTELYEQADEDSAAWEAFLTALRSHFGDGKFTGGQLADDLDTDRLSDVLPPPLAAASDKGTGQQSFRVKLGTELRRHAGTRYGPTNVHLERTGELRRAAVWRVREDMDPSVSL